jgi:hypothetical protein
LNPLTLACSRRPWAARLIPALDANERKVMRNRIFGGIGVVWGGGMLVSAFLRGGPEGSGAYGAGQTAALVFAVLLVVVGGYYLLKGSGKKL